MDDGATRLPNRAMSDARWAPRAVIAISACRASPSQKRGGYSAFAAVESRGALVMRVDQCTSVHVFEEHARRRAHR